MSGVYKKEKERLFNIVNASDIKAESSPRMADHATKREADKFLAKLMWRKS